VQALQDTLLCRSNMPEVISSVKKYLKALALYNLRDSFVFFLRHVEKKVA
jgi:hypothetical protein